MTDYNNGQVWGWNGGECPVHPETAVNYTEGDIVFSTGLKPQAEWSFDPNFYIRFDVSHKKPHLIARFLQRWLLGIYWRDVK